MKTPLNLFKETLRTRVLDQLWNQWSVLGVAGAGEVVDLGLVDPEALILQTVNFASYDLRLFDEMLAWLESQGMLINTKRLLKLEHQHGYEQRRLLAGIAEYVSVKHVNWKRVKELDYSGEAEVGFGVRGLEKSGLDPLFLMHGVHRVNYRNRRISTQLDFLQKNALLLRLRSLLGMNAHCEILCYYADGRRVHASAAARDLGYSQKAIQEALASMERVAGVSCYQSGKQKMYQLNRELWSSLVPREVTWADPIKNYVLVKDAWDLLGKLSSEDKGKEDSQLLATLIKHEFLTWKKKHGSRYDSKLEYETGEVFLEKWLEWVQDCV